MNVFISLRIQYRALILLLRKIALRGLPGFALVPFFSCTHEKAPQNPNIVLILIDQKWDGQNMWPAIRGDWKGTQAPRLLYWNYWDIRIALRHGDWKIISPTENAPFELYNLAIDTYEQNDLADSEPEQLESLLKKLEETRALDRKGRAPWVR